MRTQQQCQRPAYIGNYNGKIGLTYNLNPKTHIDVFGVYSRRKWELDAATRTYYDGEISLIPSDFLEGEETNASRQYSLSTHIHHQLSPKHSLSADYDYLNFNIQNPTRYTLQNLDAADELLDETAFFTEKATPFDFHVARLDYQGKWNDKLQFEVGIKLTLSDVANYTALSDENGIPDADNLFTDSLSLDEQIYAAYVATEGKLSPKLSFTAGLRYEYSDLELSARREDISRQISRFFPTVSLTRTFSEFSQLTVAYRERISRPGFQNLAPAFFFLNPYTVLAGNIQALPNINQTLEVTLRHHALFLSLNYAVDDNPIIRYAIPFLNQDENLLLLVSDNIENRQQLGLNVGFPLTFTRFWSSRYNVGAYWRRDEIDLIPETRVESHPFFTIDISQDFQLHKSWSLSLSGTWNSLVYQGTIYQPQQTTLNFGLQKKFDRATLTLSCTDIFDTGTFLGFINELPEQGISYDWHYEFEGSIFRLAYSYRFGMQRTKKQRRSGASEILKRVNE
ncbi:MAG: outer membrane beta-barrel family protein [Bacteroidota bacterium]